MRDILFKAKRKDNGEWVEGLLGYDMSGNIAEIESHNGFGDCRIYEIDPETICQYTGLKSGSQKIWENDIIEILSEDGYFKCEWEDDTARIVMNGDGLSVDFDNFWAYEVEVVGNIFDNTELLEVE